MFLPTACATLRMSACGIVSSMRYFQLSRRFFGFTQTFKSKSMKIAVLGAGGRTGTTLSFFLKHCSLIDELAIYDVTPVCHVALELNHIDTKCRVAAGVPGDEGLKSVLQDSKIVVITAGLQSPDGSNQNDILTTNAQILAYYVLNVIKHSPRAIVAVATSPINQLIPMAGELYKRYGIFDYNRLFGITTLDCVRANTFAAEILGLEPECLVVPVIGGSCPRTRIPLFSQTQPCNEFTNEEISKLTYAVRMAEEEVTKEYNGMEKASVAMGFAAARFCMSLCKGLQDQRGVVECAYVRSCVLPEVTYLTAPVELGPDGIQRHLGIPPLTNYECKLLGEAIPIIKNSIRIGETLALGPRVTSTEICPTYHDDCDQEISRNLRITSVRPSSCSPS
ncbi:malate dehydrogenase, mitochondrial [Fopius arisanus]|uniref:Malate dehydrogenase, mitochondrial n=1 Tax=Fopius arisanus TaxID=64838 RepID=A0A0C9RF61_9HYME|nr:PREDICTED: malate dehydrogenase, mitochondrial-like [Fopius arisanus]